MRITKLIGEDQLEVETLSGVAGSEPFRFDVLNPDGSVLAPLDISGIAPLVEITDGNPLNPGPNVLLSLSEGNGIARDDATGTFTVSVTMAQMTPGQPGGLPLGDHAFRFLFFAGTLQGDCIDRPFFGVWRHRKAR